MYIYLSSWSGSTHVFLSRKIALQELHVAILYGILTSMYGVLVCKNVCRGQIITKRYACVLIFDHVLIKLQAFRYLARAVGLTRETLSQPWIAFAIGICSASSRLLMTYYTCFLSSRWWRWHRCDCIELDRVSRGAVLIKACMIQCIYNVLKPVALHATILFETFKNNNKAVYSTPALHHSLELHFPRHEPFAIVHSFDFNLVGWRGPRNFDESTSRYTSRALSRQLVAKCIGTQKRVFSVFL